MANTNKRNKRAMRAKQGVKYAAVAIVPEREFEDTDMSFAASTVGGHIEVWLPNEPTYNHPDEIQGHYPEDGEGIWITLVGPTEPNHKGEAGSVFLVEQVL